MSRAEHEDDCPGCRPALVDMKTQQPVPANDPRMLAVDRVWDTTTLEEREAFHRVTCLNSRAPDDMVLVQGLSDRITKALTN